MSCEVAEDLSGQIFEVTCIHNSIPTLITRHGLAHVCGHCPPDLLCISPVWLLGQPSTNGTVYLPLLGRIIYHVVLHTKN